jgi:D-alanine-D-alanine ligase
MAAVRNRKLFPVIHGAPAPGRPDELDTRLNAELIAAALERLGFASDIVEVDLDFAALERLKARGAHAVFNLVEGTRGDGRLSHLAGAVLDHLGLPYTGARTEAFFLTLTKSLTKRTLRAAGLPTADWWPTGEGAEHAARVIVKSDAEHASYGMDAGSVVPGARAAEEIAARQARFGGLFIAEAFVDGREFNVALLETADGPLVLPIPEIPFDDLPPDRPRIVDYEAKWIEGSVAYQVTARRFGLERKEPALARRLAEIARGCWDAFGLRGYARVDFRVSEAGEPYVLEVNANPCLAPDAGFASTAREMGLEFDALIGRIVEAAVGPEVLPLPTRGRGACNGVSKSKPPTSPPSRHS